MGQRAGSAIPLAGGPGATGGGAVSGAGRGRGPPFRRPPGALPRARLVTSGPMTNRIDRLMRKDLVRREPDPRDRRGVLVTLTEQGRQRVDAALAGLLRRERMLLAGPEPRGRPPPPRPMRVPPPPLCPG